MADFTTRRLSANEWKLAQCLFALMADVFEEPTQPLRPEYLERLLAKEEFWVVSAFHGSELVGGLTAHALPMTRTESSEIFIYDIAVSPEHQRRGVGRTLIAHLRRAAAALGMDVIFVAADNEDAHALDFYRAVGGAPSPVTFFTFGE